MKQFSLILTLVISFALTPISYAREDEQFITDPAVQLKEGYGLTSLQYISYERANPGIDLKYKKRNCYTSKIKQYSTKMKQLEKDSFVYTNTEIFINNLLTKEGEIATFLVTYVKDTYEEAMFEDETSSLGRPADYLIYRYFHFECELKGNKHIKDSARFRGKDIPTEDSHLQERNSKGKSK